MFSPVLQLFSRRPPSFHDSVSPKAQNIDPTIDLLGYMIEKGCVCGVGAGGRDGHGGGDDGDGHGSLDGGLEDVA
ncbi:hypothetical protein E3N88_45289 [Mikania micrantha]|uniref:Uncharacterized protein n=1 Tax=Mikania micrantha TaxID=192012 RepID=A0A5N6L9K2_9ASTR|nr:hypothetical protein E3N88_45289 [Mikania micrantha]